MPSSLVPLFESESKCETIRMEMTFICMKMKLHAELIFILKGFALRLVLRQRYKRSRKWPIVRLPLCIMIWIVYVMYPSHRIEVTDSVDRKGGLESTSTLDMQMSTDSCNCGRGSQSFLLASDEYSSANANAERRYTMTRRDGWGT